MLLACPDVFEGYHLRFLLLEVGKITEAEKTISRAMQLFPEDVGFALDKATLLVVQNQYNQALEYLDKIESTLDVNIGDPKKQILLQEVETLHTRINDMAANWEGAAQTKGAADALQNADDEIAKSFCG